jgi:hypothetical protein
MAIDLALAAGDWDEAERYAARLERYMRDEPLPWPEFVVARGRALAAWGRGRRDAALAAELKRLLDAARAARLTPAAAALEKAALGAC